MQKLKTVWLNGTFVTQSDAACRVDSPSLANGMAVLEDVPVFSGATGVFALRVADHVRQFLRSAKIAQMDVPFTADKLQGAVAKTASVGEFSSGNVRMMVLYASAPEAGCAPEVSVAMFCTPAPSLCDEPISACISSWRAISNNALPPQALLVAMRANAEFALRDARACGFGQAVLLDEAGDVCSCAGAALFTVRDGVLSTPPVSCGVRESVERDTVINFAMDLDIPIVEERITRADLYCADEVFFCDGIAGVLPVSSVDGRTVGMPGKREKLVLSAEPGKPGPITKAVQGRYAKLVACGLEEYSAWVTPIA